MKNILFLSFLFITLSTFAQFNSYMDNKSEIEMVFAVNFLEQTSSKVENKFIISARDDYEISMQLGKLKDLSSTLKYAFELAECETCVQHSESLTKFPIKYVLDLIEYQDVFLITKEGNQFKVNLYRPKE